MTRKKRLGDTFKKYVLLQTRLVGRLNRNFNDKQAYDICNDIHDIVSNLRHHHQISYPIPFYCVETQAQNGYTLENGTEVYFAGMSFYDYND